MIIARAVFCLSVAATLFWAFGLAAERITGSEPPLWSYVVPAIVVTCVCTLVLFRVWPRFLAFRPGTAGRFFRGVAIWTLVAYAVGLAVVGALAFSFLDPGAQTTEALRSEASLAAYILAFWLPLWFSPAVGLSLAWWRAAGDVRSNSTVERNARKSGARGSP
jgi:hypothetical protein